MFGVTCKKKARFHQTIHQWFTLEMSTVASKTDKIQWNICWKQNIVYEKWVKGIRDDEQLMGKMKMALIPFELWPINDKWRRLMAWKQWVFDLFWAAAEKRGYILHNCGLLLKWSDLNLNDFIFEKFLKSHIDSRFVIFFFWHENDEIMTFSSNIRLKCGKWNGIKLRIRYTENWRKKNS